MAIGKTYTKADLGHQVKAWRKEGQKIGLVPTMGALHAGHVSLVSEILKHVDRVVVSIFVNPTQFSPAEDFDTYPREEDKDCAKLEIAGAHLVYLPDVSEIYEKDTTTIFSDPLLSGELCGKFRQDHFDGVATVVAKLLQHCLPDVAIFGEKDFQQLRVIQTMVSTLALPVKIIGSKTIRENDGLAMSSRNAYLSKSQRAVSATLFTIMNDLIVRGLAGENLRTLEYDGQKTLKQSGFSAVDYLDFHESDNLSHSEKITAKTRLFAAVHVGKTRLIDNMKVE